jgi:hypothetical protein
LDLSGLGQQSEKPHDFVAAFHGKSACGKFIEDADVSLKLTGQRESRAFASVKRVNWRGRGMPDSSHFKNSPGVIDRVVYAVADMPNVFG